MAIWQYVTYLVPNTAITPEGTLRGVIVTREGWEHEPFTFALPAAEMETLISGYLPRGVGWGEDMRLWGHTEHDDVQMYYEGDRIEVICARLDLSSLSRERITSLVRLAKQADCCFLEGRTLRVFPADEDALIQSIRQSRPAQYCADPHGFFERLARESTEKPQE